MKSIILKILYLVRDARFCMRFGMDSAYKTYAESNGDTIIKFDNMFVVWSGENAEPCPSYRDIENVDKLYAEKLQDMKDEDSLVLHYKDDMALKSLYVIAKKENGLLTFKEFIQNARVLKVV